MSKCGRDNVSFAFAFLCDVVTLVFEGKYGVIFRPFWRDMLAWRTPKAAREIAFVRNIFRPKVAYLEDLNEIEKNRLDV